jgi:transcription elongation factor Elf1
MSAKCPSCESKVISFTTDAQTSDRILSCIDCGSEWNISVDVDPPKKSRFRSLLGLDSK